MTAEVALRRLVSGRLTVLPAGQVDLRALLPAGADLHLAAPAEPVLLTAGRAAELAAAVGAAVDNARRHGGGQAWLLVEDEPAGVTVTVRDDGSGFDPALVPAGHGLNGSVHGRARDAGGGAEVVTAPGDGCEVRVCIPSPAHLR